MAGGVPEVRKATLTVLLDERGKRPRKQVIEGDMRTALANLPGAFQGRTAAMVKIPIGAEKRRSLSLGTIGRGH